MNAPLWTSIEDEAFGFASFVLPKTPDAVQERNRELQLIAKERQESRRFWQRLNMENTETRLADAARMREHERNMDKNEALRKEINRDKILTYKDAPNRLCVNVDTQYLPVVHTLDKIEAKLALIKGKRNV